MRECKTIDISRHCLWCGDEFYIPKDHLNKKYCGEACSRANANKGSKEKYLALRKLKEEDYNLNPKKCLTCETALPFQGAKTKKFCNRSCSAIYNNRMEIRGESKLKIYQSKEEQRTAEKQRRDAKILGIELDGPVTRVTFKICEITGLPYLITGPNGKIRKRSPYIDTEKEAYYKKAKFKFNVYHFPEEFDLNLIEELGWYTCPGKKRKNGIKNTAGVSRDHLFSISEGFKLGVDPKILSHPANCRIISHLDNKVKGTHSSITLEELLDRIEKWNKKYSVGAG